MYKIRYRAPIVPGQRKTREVVETLAHCPNLNAAKGVLAKRRASIFEGTYRPRNAQKPVLLAEFIETFLAARKGELASWSSYKAALKLHVAPFFAKKYLFEITTGDCEDYRRHRIAQGAAPASVRNELRYMQSVFADARKRGIVTTDPVADVSFAGTKHAPTKAPTPAEILALVEAARQEEQGSFLRPLFFVMLCTGLRLQSALALRWENVDYDGGAVGTMQKGGTWVWPPMPQLLRDELQRWQPISEGAAKDGWVFPSVRTHEPVTQTAVQKAWPRLLRRAKVDGISRHDLRRFVVTRLRELGADDKSIGRISGHATAAMIDRYDKRGIDAVTEFAEKATDLALLAAAADRTSIAGIRNGVSNTEKQNAKNEVE